jgi:hypothetical protein
MIAMRKHDMLIDKFSGCCRTEAVWEELPAAVAQLPPAGYQAR